MLGVALATGVARVYRACPVTDWKAERARQRAAGLAIVRGRRPVVVTSPKPWAPLRPLLPNVEPHLKYVHLDIRDDVRQDVILGVLEGEIDRRDIASAVRKTVARIERGRHEAVQWDFDDPASAIASDHDMWGPAASVGKRVASREYGED